MIYTITFNPALDYTVQVEEFEIGKINRTKSENILAGGKGLNVSIILKRLGIENTALSFIAGFTGKELERKIKQYNIKTDELSGFRVTSKLRKADFEDFLLHGVFPVCGSDRLYCTYVKGKWHLPLLHHRRRSLQRSCS